MSNLLPNLERTYFLVPKYRLGTVYCGHSEDCFSRQSCRISGSRGKYFTTFVDQGSQVHLINYTNGASQQNIEAQEIDNIEHSISLMISEINGQYEEAAKVILGKM